MYRRTATALPGVLLLAGLAHADANEWRITAAAAGLLSTTRAAGTDGEGVGFGGRMRFGYGLMNSLDVLAEASIARTQALEFESARIESLTGNLFADATTAELALGFRWSFGVEIWRALERIHPFVGIRGGGMVRRLSGQVLLNSANMELASPRDDITLVPFAAGTAGIERRFGDHFFVGLAFDAGFGKGYRALGGSLELAWAWY
jgi:hypothetical protein